MDGLVVDVCRARARLDAARRDTAAARKDASDTYRSVSSLLTDAMHRSEAACVRYTRGDGTACYARLAPRARRAVALKSVADVLVLLEDVARDVAHVASEELPVAVARLVEARARAKGTVAPPRVAFVPRVGTRAQVVEHTAAPREVGTLVAQAEASHREVVRLRAEIKPVRQSVRAAEAALCAQTPPADAGAPAVVKMAVPGGAERAVRVTTEWTEKKRRGVFGLRHVCRVVREATERVAAQRDAGFDARLRDEVTRLLSVPQEAEWTRKVVVKRAPLP